jgi:hypothetical protein
MQLIFKFCKLCLDRALKLQVDACAVFVLMVIFFHVSGCIVGQPSSGTDIELQRAIKIWRESHITDYDFVMVRYAGGMSAWVPVSVKVRHGKVVSVAPVREPLELERVDGYDDYDTVEKCFDRIQESYNRKEKTKVTYNHQLGYPETIAFDDPKKGIDAFYTINISEFKVTRNQ